MQGLRSEITIKFSLGRHHVEEVFSLLIRPTRKLCSSTESDPYFLLFGYAPNEAVEKHVSILTRVTPRAEEEQIPLFNYLATWKVYAVTF